MGFITFNSCPVCNSIAIEKELSAEDFTVTHQVFEIWECKDCTLRFTQHIPDATSVVDYYQSDAYISHTDTSEGIVNKLYHLVRKKTLKKKLRLVQRATKTQKGNVLDIGAGTGAFMHTMQQAGWQITGLEPDETTRKRAAKLYDVNLQNSQQLFNLPLNSFTAATMWHVLEHVHELHAYIAQIKLLLKKDGKAFIAVPNYTAYDAQWYKKHWAAYDVPRHLYHFSPTALEKLIQQHGLQLISIKPMWYDSFYIAMLSEQYKTNKNNLLKAIIIAVWSNIITLFNNGRCSSVIYIIGHK